MPVDRIQESSLPKPLRETKLTLTEEWIGVQDALKTDLKAGEVLRVTIGEKTKQLYDDVRKAAVALTLKLRAAYKGRYEVKLIGGTEIRMKLDEKKKP